jgi:transcriptional regulator with XRE-family HTH domain
MTDKQFLKIFGTNIAKRRKSFGLTQEQLSVNTNTSQDFISRLENGGLKQFNVERLWAVAEALHCSIADLLNLPENDQQNSLADITNDNVVKFADIIRPLSADDQAVVVGTVAEMVRLINKNRKKKIKN